MTNTNGKLTYDKFNGNRLLDMTQSISCILSYFKKKQNFMAPFYGWGSTASRLVEPPRGGSLLFTTKFSEIPGTRFIDLRRMKV